MVISILLKIGTVKLLKKFTHSFKCEKVNIWDKIMKSN